jgi:hypothetical protein
MATQSAAQLKKRMGHLWHEVLVQVEGLRGSVAKQTTGAARRVLAEIDQLKQERTRLINRLGEQTLAAVNSNKARVPNMLQPTVHKLNDLLEQLLAKREQPSRDHHVHVKKETVTTKPAAKKARTAKAKAAPRAKKAGNKQPVARKPLVEDV